jgi:type I restriction enzyme S subunit
VAQPNINARQYGQDLLIPLPPLSLQQVFTLRIGVTESVREVGRTLCAEGNSLFESLQHRAFRGEL